MSGQGSVNTIDQLLGSQTGGPNQTVTQDMIRRFRVSANIVRQNFTELEDFVDGKLDQDALLIVYTPSGGEAVSYLYRHIHNYLSSLYSFNEQAIEKISDYSSGSVSKHDIISGQSLYSEKLAFIRGLRHDVQHGDYKCLSLNRRHSAGDFNIYCIEFDQQSYINGGVRNPHDYLRHTTQQDRQYPLPYIANFHKQYFNDFVDDLMNWLQGNP